ncbi:hypothetical protein M2T37_27715, partial [Klebsiella pneumoniae]|uniref:hypothetical protein n=1 Tax=Klebsiella pneumoniae TaxID=573 RepID=UPI00200BA678
PRTQELSSITVLLTDRADGFSAMHKLEVDEGWQWLDGAPVALLRAQLRQGRPVPRGRQAHRGEGRVTGQAIEFAPQHVHDPRQRARIGLLLHQQ